MKSVSFSDLRNSSEMSNFDSNIKRSSSIKQLTYYNSSEDILRRFSTKTAEKFLSKEPRKIEEYKNEIEPKTTETETLSIEEPKSEIQIQSQEKTIKELRDQLTQKNNIIANLQDENLLLQNESTKNSEQVKYLENRIKYLEHALAAFTSSPQEKIQQTNIKHENLDKENSEKINYSTSQNSMKSKPLGSRVNFDVETPVDEKKNSNNYFNKNRYGNENFQNQDKITDLKKRPTSADSTLQNSYPTSSKLYENDSYSQSRQASIKLYDSDTEPNNSYKTTATNSYNDNQKPSSANFINFQRQKLERDRSMNLSEFKSRLDEFTKYARKSTEQNSLRNSTTSMPQSNEYKSIQKYHVTPDKWTDSNSKSRVKSLNQYSRPPIDPCYKQRRNNPYETKISNEPIVNYTPTSQNEEDEDVVLKERVKKILEKHNYPISNTYYTNVSDNMSNNMVDSIGFRDEFSSHTHKRYGNNESNKTVDWRNSNSPTQYGATTNGRNTYNDSNVPRLDLTRNEQYSYFPEDTSDLLNKYLNYQGYANVS